MDQTGYQLANMGHTNGTGDVAHLAPHRGTGIVAEVISIAALDGLQQQVNLHFLHHTAMHTARPSSSISADPYPPVWRDSRRLRPPDTCPGPPSSLWRSGR